MPPMVHVVRSIASSEGRCCALDATLQSVCGCSWGDSSVQPAFFQRQEPGSGGNRRCSAPHRVESLNPSEIQRKTGGARPATPSNFRGGKLAPGPTTKATEEVHQRAPSLGGLAESGWPPEERGVETHLLFCSRRNAISSERCTGVTRIAAKWPSFCRVATTTACMGAPLGPRECVLDRDWRSLSSHCGFDLDHHQSSRAAPGRMSRPRIAAVLGAVDRWVSQYRVEIRAPLAAQTLKGVATPEHDPLSANASPERSMDGAGPCTSPISLSSSARASVKKPGSFVNRSRDSAGVFSNWMPLTRGIELESGDVIVL